MATPKLQGKAGKLNMVIEQGTTFNPSMLYKDSAGSLIDLTGYHARMHIRPSYTSSSVYAYLNDDNGGVILGGAAGTIKLFISDAETESFTWSNAVYDLELISASGVVTRILKGSIVISDEVTRPAFMTVFQSIPSIMISAAGTAS